MATTLQPVRFFSDFYDSIIQREYTQKNNELCQVSFLGRIRFDILLSKYLLLTDTQLLDGNFFIDFGASKLNDALKRTEVNSLPIIVSARSNTLEDSLLRFVKRTNEPKLRGFSFSSIEDDQVRMDVKRELENVDSKEISSWEDIPRILHKIGVNDATTQRLKGGWTSWIEAQKRGLIQIERWEGKFEIDKFINSPQLIEEQLKSEIGKGALKWVYEHRSDRNSIDIHLTKLRQQHIADQPVCEDILIIDTWFNRSYSAATAFQTNCSNYESVRDGLASVSYKDQGLVLRDGRIVSLEASLPFTDKGLGFIYSRLGSMPSSNFRGLFWQNRNNENFQKWWMNGDVDALKCAIEPYVQAIEGEHMVEHSNYKKMIIDCMGQALGEGIGYTLGGFSGLMVGSLFGGATSVFLNYVLTEQLLRSRERKMSQRIISNAKDRIKE
jgi:hypothetical protein